MAEQQEIRSCASSTTLRAVLGYFKRVSSIRNAYVSGWELLL